MPHEHYLSFREPYVVGRNEMAQILNSPMVTKFRLSFQCKIEFRHGEYVVYCPKKIPNKVRF